MGVLKVHKLRRKIRISKLLPCLMVCPHHLLCIACLTAAKHLLVGTSKSSYPSDYNMHVSAFAIRCSSHDIAKGDKSGDVIITKL